MSQATIEIKEASVVETRVFSKVKIEMITVKLHESVSIMYSLLDKNNMHVKGDIMVLEGSDYKDWASDDNYLENMILAKLDFTRV